MDTLSPMNTCLNDDGSKLNKQAECIHHENDILPIHGKGSIHQVPQ